MQGAKDPRISMGTWQGRMITRLKEIRSWLELRWDPRNQGEGGVIMITGGRVGKIPKKGAQKCFLPPNSTPPPQKKKIPKKIMTPPPPPHTQLRWLLMYGLYNKEYYIWNALNDLKIGGLVTGAKWPVTLFLLRFRFRCFIDVIYDSLQLIWFKRFLTEKQCEAPLLFWQAVENMKMNCKDGKARQARAMTIVKKYFTNIPTTAGRLLHFIK